MKYSTACHNRNKIFRHRTEVPKLQTARRDMFAGEQSTGWVRREKRTANSLGMSAN